MLSSFFDSRSVSGQSQKEKVRPETVHSSRHQVAQAAFKSENAGQEDRKADEAIRRILEAEGPDARHRLGSPALGGRTQASSVRLRMPKEAHTPGAPAPCRTGLGPYQKAFRDAVVRLRESGDHRGKLLVQPFTLKLCGPA